MSYKCKECGNKMTSIEYRAKACPNCISKEINIDLANAVKEYNDSIKS